MKRLFSIILSVVVLLSFSGCNYLLGESDNLLQAPRPDGTLRKIQKALKTSEIGDGYKLKAAKSGNYRTSYIVKDINGDGVDEAMVFYSLTKNKESTLQFSLLKAEGDNWQVKKSRALGGTNIERVDFGDLNGDKNDEMVIAWNIYNSPETRLSVFNLKNFNIEGIFEEKYTDFCIYDMDVNGKDDLLIFTIDTILKVSRCSMYKASGNKLNKTDEILTDKNASGYKNIRRSAVDGKPALFVDCVLAEGGLFTELITYQSGKLAAPLFQQSGQSSMITKRTENIICGDADGDGVVEIPCDTVVPSGGDTENALSLIEWRQYSGGELSVKERSVVSKALQYKFRINEEWLEDFACKTSDFDGIDFYEFKNGKLGDKVFSLAAVSNEGYEHNHFEEWFTINQNYQTIYLGKIEKEKSGFGEITRETIKKYFSEKVVEE